MPAPTSTELRQYVPADALLADRVILVTGASGSIGGALAQSCARLGARVILSGRSVKKLERIYDSIVADGSPRPSIAPIDFEKADAAAYDALADAIGSEFGRLDGLAHVGAILGDRSPIAHYDVPTWLKVMHVNVNAPFILTRTLLPLLEKSTDPSIVFTTRSPAGTSAPRLNQRFIGSTVEKLAQPSTSHRQRAVIRRPGTWSASSALPSVRSASSSSTANAGARSRSSGLSLIG